MDFLSLKIGLPAPKKVALISSNETSLKMMRNAFYLMLKALFVLEIFTFLSCLFGYGVKRLDKQAKVNLKIYVVTDWTANITITILSNISRSKDNQTIKLGKLIEYNLRNLFLEKSYTKYGGKASPRPF